MARSCGEGASVEPAGEPGKDFVELLLRGVFVEPVALPVGFLFCGPMFTHGALKRSFSLRD